MLQQGQVFKLTSTGAHGMPLWAYRYLLHERGTMTAGELAAGSGLTSGATTRLLDRLERIGRGIGPRCKQRLLSAGACPRLPDLMYRSADASAVILRSAGSIGYRR